MFIDWHRHLGEILRWQYWSRWWLYGCVFRGKIHWAVYLIFVYFKKIYANPTSLKQNRSNVKLMNAIGVSLQRMFTLSYYRRQTEGNMGDLLNSCMKIKDKNTWSHHLFFVLALAFKIWLLFFPFLPISSKTNSLPSHWVNPYILFQNGLSWLNEIMCMSVCASACVCVRTWVHIHLCLLMEHEEQASYFMLLSFHWS